ncbi:DNA-processing protein DprA [Lacticaseibacillus pabuli]|uniref:DNA-processing protein DprA n=1 Tax=Lacticaseibacillus pabuli TaxID=3025672 RepID=A0ABY7WPF0_9LACO|nr:DNA-processing protein DprA [Lacticaseibacillus sp. KACC 23028]WDF81551.1 DNA-processing protein DprA [Lacticaseibacillus sp. KACC 23028]
MEIRELLLLAHLASGASPTLARNLLAALNAKAPIEEATLYQLVSRQGRDQLTTYLTSPHLRAQFEALRHQPFLTCVDPEFPARLYEMAQTPLVLFYEGDLRLLSSADDPSSANAKRKVLGVVGSRKATRYTVDFLEYLMPRLDPSTIIVSGLAFGADSMAHRAALDNGMATIAVIGTGCDRYYPPQHRQLQLQIAREGLLLSEYPPGTDVLPYRFVARNRIIAGLAHGLLVTEAATKSGTLITAKMALEAGRSVFALPNRFDAPLGMGTNDVVKAGATFVTSAVDIRTELQYF